MSAAPMRLTYLPANAAHVFTFGDSLIRMGDAPMFHSSRRNALAAARACGMHVDRSGRVRVSPSTATPCDWCDAPDVPGFVMWDGNRACAHHREVWYADPIGA